MAVAGECPVCTVPLGYRETCPSPSCPCYGMRAGTDEMQRAAAAWRSRPSVAAARTLSAEAAEGILERRAWLAYQEARNAYLDVIIEHESQ